MKIISLSSAYAEYRALLGLFSSSARPLTPAEFLEWLAHE